MPARREGKRIPRERRPLNEVCPGIHANQGEAQPILPAVIRAGTATLLALALLGASCSSDSARATAKRPYVVVLVRDEFPGDSLLVRSFYLIGDPTEHLAFMVPESSLHAGRNAVEVLEVGPSERLRLLGRS